MNVKICGITRLEDAELAISLGAWGIGLMLWPESKRYVDPAVAAGIARRLRRKVELVGVFVNQPLDEIADLVDVPAGKTVVSESGIHMREQLDELERVGVDAVLIGETLMRAPDIEAAARELTGFGELL